MASVFRLPGNIKQQFLPFVLNPTSPVNIDQDGGSRAFNGLAGAKPQLFTYRQPPADYGSNAARLNFCPSSFRHCQPNQFDLDLANQLLYGANNEQMGISFDSLINRIPGVTIREYLPDTRLEQVINVAADLMTNLADTFSSPKTEAKKSTPVDSASKDKNGNVSNASTTPNNNNNASSPSTSTPQNTNQSTQDTGINWTRIWKTCCFVMEYLVGTSQPKNLYSNPENFATKGVPNANHGVFKRDDIMKTSVITFPFMLYYKLLSSLTTNIFQVPTVGMTDAYQTDGNAGWTGGKNFRLDFKALETVDKLGLFSNIGIHYMPWWKPKDGVSKPANPIVVKFDLFNDSAEAALANFIFINTIVPDNLWIQYNIFQHSSHIYDVSIDGLGRSYACSGSFKISYKGVLREPSASWLNKHLKKRINKNYDAKKLINLAKTKNLLKIPDVYSVELTFQPLLPDNFNTFIYRYTQESDTIDECSKNMYTPSGISDVIPKTIRAFATEVKNVWDNNGEYKSEFDGLKTAFKAPEDGKK